jgi:transposase
LHELPLGHIRRHMVRAGDASPVQLKYWTQNWLDLFWDLYRAHDKLMAAWQQEAAAPPAREKEAAAERPENAYGDWDTAIGVIDETRKKQMQAPGGGSHNGQTARNAAVIWTVTATAQMAGLNLLTYLTAYLDECGRNGGKPLSGKALERFLPWKASPEDRHAWAQPPPPG